MDGVPGLTQAPVMPGESFTYEFDAAPAGTYFYHPHVGLQLDRGLYGALIIEPTEEPSLASRPDREYVLMLDDWLTIEPEAALAQMLRRGGWYACPASPASVSRSMIGANSAGGVAR